MCEDLENWLRLTEIGFRLKLKLTPFLIFITDIWTSAQAISKVPN